MRWSSLFAASLLAAGIVVLQQPLAYSAGGVKPPAAWSAEVVLDDGAPEEVAPQSFEALRARLEPDDPVAVLEAVGYALAEVGDGETYVWHRTDGALMGNVHIVGTFRGGDGAVCRKLNLTLILGDMTRPATATACRDAGGHWALGG